MRKPLIKIILLILGISSIALIVFPQAEYFKNREKQLKKAKDIYKDKLQYNFKKMKEFVPSSQLKYLGNTKLYITLKDEIVFAQASWTDNSIQISAATILFIEELAVTFAWFESEGIKNKQPIINYVLLLRKQMRKNLLKRKVIPTMAQALDVPSEDIWERPDEDSVKTIAQNFLKSTVIWILAHEMGHIALGHLKQSKIFSSKLERAQYIRELELDADEFAMRIMARLRLSPIGMALTMSFYCLLYPVRLDFKYEEDWEEYLANENHPIWPERFERLSQLYKEYERDYDINANINIVTQSLIKLSELLKERDVLDAMIVGSEKLTFENIMYFDPLKNIDKKYYKR